MLESTLYYFTARTTTVIIMKGVAKEKLVRASMARDLPENFLRGRARQTSVNMGRSGTQKKKSI